MAAFTICVMPSLAVVELIVGRDLPTHMWVGFGLGAMITSLIAEILCHWKYPLEIPPPE